MTFRVLFALCLLVAPFGCSKSTSEKVADYTAKGVGYLNGGKTDEAILELRNALQIAPKDRGVLSSLGEAYLRKGQLGEAYRAFRKVAELDPKNVTAQLRLGELFLMANAVGDARNWADKALAAAPNMAGVQELMGNILLRDGKTDEALRHFDRAIVLEPDKSAPQLAKAKALLAVRRLSDARQLLEEVLAKDGKNAQALLVLAQVTDLQNDREATTRTLALMLKAAPEDPEVWMNYGRFCLSKGETSRALDAFRKSGERDSRGTAGWEKVAELSVLGADFVGARNAVDAILARNAKSLSGKYYSGRIQLGEGKYKEAARTFQEVERQDSRHPEAGYFAGVALYAQGSPGLAKMELQKMIEVNPGLVKARMLLAQIYLDEGGFQQAMEATEKMGTGGKIPPEAVMLRSAALMGLGKTEQARGLLEILVKAFPHDARARERLGLCYLREKRMEDALESFRKALDEDPKSVRPLFLSVQILLQQKKFDEAIARCSAYMKTAGDSASVRELLGRVHIEKGDRKSARRELERAVSLDANAAQAYLLLAGLQDGPLALHAALADVEKAVKVRPGYVQGWVLKGVMQDALGQQKEAEKAYRKALELNPNSIVALNNLAWNLAEYGGNLDEALKFSEQAVELAPKTPFLNDTLGWIYVKKGVYQTALNHLEPYAELLSKSPDAQYHLGKAYAGVGDKNKAVAFLKRALSLSKKFAGSDDAEKTLLELEARGKG